MMRFRFTRPFLKPFSCTFLAAVTASFVMLGCADQPEGGRCDPNNNNDDCQSGLTCQKIQGQLSPLCCPPPPARAKVAACIPGQSLTSDSGPRPDSDTVDSDTNDTQTSDADTEDTNKSDTDISDADTKDTETKDTDTPDTKDELDAPADTDDTADATDAADDTEYETSPDAEELPPP